MKTRKVLLAALCCVFFATAAQAQDLSGLLSGIAKTVLGDQTTTESSIVGTWTFCGPDCHFESDNLLAEAGGEAVATQIESKLQGVYSFLGLSGSSFTFDSDKNFAFSYKGVKAASGTYTFDSEEKTITFKTNLGFSFKAYVTVTGTSMSLLFNADKLMDILKTLTSSDALAGSSYGSTISALVGNYNGLRLGFELSK